MPIVRYFFENKITIYTSNRDKIEKHENSSEREKETKRKRKILR